MPPAPLSLGKGPPAHCHLPSRSHGHSPVSPAVRSRVWRLAEESPYPTVISWYRLCPWEKGQPRSLEGRLYEIYWLLRCTSQTRSSAQLTAGRTHTKPMASQFPDTQAGQAVELRKDPMPTWHWHRGPALPNKLQRASGKAGSKLTLLAFPCDLGKVPPVFCLVSPSGVERNRDVMAVSRLCCRHKRHTHAL